MLYYKDNKYHLSKLKVHYIDKHEGEVIKHIGSEGKDWWIKFAERWKDTFELIDIFEIEEDYTKEQYERLDKVNELRLPEGIIYVEEYVIEGSFENIKRNHPLYILKLEEESEKLNLELGKANMELYTTMAIMEEQHKLENAKQLMDILELISTIGGEE